MFTVLLCIVYDKYPFEYIAFIRLTLLQRTSNQDALPHSCESDVDSNASKVCSMANILNRISVNLKSFADNGSLDCKITENLKCFSKGFHKQCNNGI